MEWLMENFVLVATIVVCGGVLLTENEGHTSSGRTRPFFLAFDNAEKRGL